MLQEIAGIVINQFGKRDTYRIGGDEYVAFVLDSTEEEVCGRLKEMREQITEQGYHAAVGYEFSNAKDVDMNKLIVVAESKMYKDKSDYYKAHDRRSR